MREAVAEKKEDPFQAIDELMDGLLSRQTGK